MSTNDTYLAVFLGSRDNPRFKEWMALPEAERRTRESEGMAAWKAWMDKHQDAVVGGCRRVRGLRAVGRAGRGAVRISGRGAADRAVGRQGTPAVVPDPASRGTLVRRRCTRSRYRIVGR